jgi:hypothetical protein
MSDTTTPAEEFRTPDGRAVADRTATDVAAPQTILAPADYADEPLSYVEWLPEGPCWIHPEEIAGTPEYRADAVTGEDGEPVVTVEGWATRAQLASLAHQVHELRELVELATDAVRTQRMAWAVLMSVPTNLQEVHDQLLAAERAEANA